MASPDFCAAAERHYKDGVLLSDQERLPGADHFFGIAAECAIKATLAAAGVLEFGARGVPKKPFDQHCPGIWNEYAIAHGGHASLRRLPLPQNNPFLGTWLVTDRYEDGSAVNSNTLAAHRFGALEALKIMQALAQAEPR